MICPNCKEEINSAIYFLSETGEVTLDSDKTSLYYNPRISLQDSFVCPKCEVFLLNGSDEEELIDLLNS